MSHIVLPFDMTLPTTEGYSKVASLIPGDCLFDFNNKPIKIDSTSDVGFSAVYGIYVEDSDRPQVIIPEDAMIPLFDKTKNKAVIIELSKMLENPENYNMMGYKHWKKVVYKIRKVERLKNTKVYRISFNNGRFNQEFVQTICGRIGFWQDMSTEKRENGFNCMSYLI